MTLAVLSWGAHKTLLNTLTSYKTFGIDQIFKERIIWFQEITSEDKRIAAKFGYQAYGSPKNIGIAQAYKNLVNLATEDLFLFLENDWQALEGPQEIEDGAALLRADSVDVVRLRHRKYPGAPLWTLQYKDYEMTKPSHLLDAVHWTEHPEKKFPPHIWKKDNFYLSHSQTANWTNNPTMFVTEFLKHVVVPHMGTRDVEIDLQEWWEHQLFIVAQGDGIFTHHRIG